MTIYGVNFALETAELFKALGLINTSLTVSRQATEYLWLRKLFCWTFRA